MDPLGHWRANDAPDRQGITEIRYIEGYFAYWDELLRRHPNMLIDTCASGGRRLDLETLRRAVSLLRSDHWAGAADQQCQNYGISLWIPFTGTGFVSFDEYYIRSLMAAEFTIASDIRSDEFDYDEFRRLFGEWKKLSKYFYGEFYPLSKYSRAFDFWMAWQYNCPEMGEGAVQAFRRMDSNSFGGQLRLFGLDADAVYELTNFDEPAKVEMTGQQLMEQGLEILIRKRPGSVIVTYKKLH